MDSTINQLNDDCLVKIFTFLSIEERLLMEKVCKRWKGISKKGWPDVKSLYLPDHSIVKKDAKKILRRCGRFVKKLIIQMSDRDKYLRLFGTIPSYCPHLRAIVIDFEYHEDVFKKCSQQLPDVFSKLRHLCNVSLDGIWSDAAINFTDLLRTLPAENLQRLYICTDDDGMSYIELLKFINLENLDLSKVLISDDSWRNFMQLQQLRSLSLTSCNISPENLYNIAHLVNLKVLKLMYMHTIQDSHISLIARSCSQLTELRLIGFLNITDSCFGEIAQLSNLKILELKTLQHITDRSIVDMCHITTLKLWYCSEISTEGILQLISKSKNLRELNIVGPQDIQSLIKCINDAVRESAEQFILKVWLGGRQLTPKDLSSSLIIKDASLGP